jgi:predicted nucleic acid-binding protein
MSQVPPFVDTNLLIRYLTGDDPQKQAAVTELIEQVIASKLTLSVPITVITEAVFVLASKRLYSKSPAEVRSLLEPILNLPGLEIEGRARLLRSLELYTSTNLNFGDCMIASAIEESGGTELYSYDTGFDQLPTLKRIEPALPQEPEEEKGEEEASQEGSADETTAQE